jgi:hypothetical protein
MIVGATASGLPASLNDVQRMGSGLVTAPTISFQFVSWYKQLKVKVK